MDFQVFILQQFNDTVYLIQLLDFSLSYGVKNIKNAKMSIK